MSSQAIIMKAQMQDPKGMLIPKGRVELLTIEILDGYAFFYFSNETTTRNFVKFEETWNKKKGKRPDTWYNELIKKGVTRYEGKTKYEIEKIIKGELEQLNKNAE